MDGNGVVGEARASGKVDRAEQVLHLGRELVVVPVMKAGEDHLKVEEGKVEETGADQQQGELIKVARIVREEVRGNSRAETSGPGGII